MATIDSLVRNVWIKAFWGFDPTNGGYIGFTRESDRDRLIREATAEDLILIYGSDSAETDSENRRQALGFLQIDPTPIMKHERQSEIDRLRNVERGTEDRWTFAVPVKRAWQVTRKIEIKHLAPITYTSSHARITASQGKMLTPQEAETVLQLPVKELGVHFSAQALDDIYTITKGYPYFLQEWGYHAWNTAANNSSIITADDVKKANSLAITNLDTNFFRVRFDRLIPSEKKYVRALAEFGGKPQRSGDIANKLGKAVEQVAPLRAQLISKGMIYSPAHGDIAFTVPLFEEFLIREIPIFSATDTY